MVNALLVSHTAPQPGTRVAAIVETSVFDAVNGISRRYSQVHPEVIGATAPHRASAPAAAASAAYTALLGLFPDQKATFDAQLAASLAALSGDEDEDGGGSQAVARGLVWGETVAKRSWLGALATVSTPFSRPTSSGRCHPGSRRRRHSHLDC
jgi:hypothetical protein